MVFAGALVVGAYIPVFLLFVKFVDFRFGIILLVILWVFEGGYNGWSEYFFEGHIFHFWHNAAEATNLF